MAKKTVLGLLVIALMFCSGFGKKNNSNELTRARAENATLRARVNQLEFANNNQRKETQKLDDAAKALKTKIQQLETANDKQQTASAALKTKIKQLEATNENQRKELQKIKKLPSKIEARPNISPNADDVVRISEPIFGIYPGEKLDELGKRFTLSENIRQGKDRRGTASSEDITQSWSIEPNDPNISKISIRSFEGYVYQILVIFKDAGEGHFETLKTRYKQTYGKEQDFGLSTIILGDRAADFFPAIDGVPIMISMFYRENSGDMGIIYVHKPLENKLTDKLGNLAKVRAF